MGITSTIKPTSMRGPADATSAENVSAHVGAADVTALTLVGAHVDVVNCSWSTWDHRHQRRSTGLGSMAVRPSWDVGSFAIGCRSHGSARAVASFMGRRYSIAARR